MKLNSLLNWITTIFSIISLLSFQTPVHEMTIEELKKCRNFREIANVPKGCTIERFEIVSVHKRCPILERYNIGEAFTDSTILFLKEEADVNNLIIFSPLEKNCNGIITKIPDYVGFTIKIKK